MTNGSLMNVESIAECSLGAFCNTFDLHKAIIGLENQFWSVFEWPRLDRFYRISSVFLFKRQSDESDHGLTWGFG